MKKDINIDDLKSIWKNQPNSKQYSQEDLFSMIQKKSVSSLKWLLYITISEFALALIFTIYTYFSKNHLMEEKVINIVGEKIINRYEFWSHFGIIFSIAFMLLAYFYYKKISSNLSIKDLINSIIKFRRIITLFILFSVLYVSIISWPILFELGKQLLLKSEKVTDLPVEKVNTLAARSGYLMAGVTTFLIFIFSAIWYSIIYGIFLRRLNKNLKELKKINN